MVISHCSGHQGGLRDAIACEKGHKVNLRVTEIAAVSKAVSLKRYGAPFI